MSNNYVFIKQKYDANDDFSNVNEKFSHFDSVNLSVDDQVAVCNIQDLLYMREDSDLLFCLGQNYKYCCNIFATDHDT